MRCYLWRAHLQGLAMLQCFNPEARLRSTRAGAPDLPLVPAVRAVICFIIYFVLGFFGAARWGASTNGNLLVNSWGPPAYQGVLNILLGGEAPHPAPSPGAEHFPCAAYCCMQGCLLQPCQCVVLHLLSGTCKHPHKNERCACAVYLALTNPPLVYPVAHIFRVRRSPSDVLALGSC